MIYTGVELFMEKLKQLIYKDDYPLISNHLPSSSPVRPQLQRLYDELQSTIHILFTENENRLHQLQEVTDLKKRFRDVAEEAHDRVDMFLSAINFKAEKLLPNRLDELEPSLNLGDIMESIESIKKKLNRTFKHMKTDSSLKTQSPAPSGASCSKVSLRSNNRWGEEVVGLDNDARLIVEKLIEDEKRLYVVSIVGMGGIVSQKFDKMDLLIKLLESIGIKVEPEKDGYSKLREKLHKKLMDYRFLFVIDDIWNTEAWDELNVLFPENHKGSRILLTSRLKEVGLHATRNGLIHELKSLTNEESWELLRKKVFHGQDCPKPLTKHGIEIAKGCNGLPLALLVIAGILAKEECEDSWEKIAQNVTSYIVSDPDRHIGTLALSIDHLPPHLKDCFLYLAGFPEDYEFRVKRLIWLLVAEGFIQEGANQSLEETAKDYLMELVDRNLVVVQSRKFNGVIKTCSVHDLLRELCLEIAMKEQFCTRNQGSGNFMVVPNKTRRFFTDHVMENNMKIQSLLFFGRHTYNKITNDLITRCLNSWMLLMVLDLQQCNLDFFPKELSLLFHLRYLAIRYNLVSFPFTICNLCGLQTLIIESSIIQSLRLPNTISNLVNLRHLLFDGGEIYFPSIHKPMNLQTISTIALGEGPNSWVKYFPSLKKISLLMFQDVEYDLKSLISLETLKMSSSSLHYRKNQEFQWKNINIMFPASLKKLTLEQCHLPWICMTEIQSLPKLEVLILSDDAFVGPCWDTGEEPFQQLKFLKLRWLDIKKWKASSINFPCLKQLVLEECEDLEEVPIEIGYIPTLELIKITYYCNESAVQSV